MSVPDAEQRLKEVRRVLKQLYRRSGEPRSRQELFEGCSFDTRWQNDVLLKFTEAGLVEREGGPPKGHTYRLMPGISLQRYFEDPSHLSSILWPSGMGLLGVSKDEAPESDEESVHIPEDRPSGVMPETSGDPIIEALSGTVALLVRLTEMTQEDRESIAGAVVQIVERVEVGVTASRFAADHQKDGWESVKNALAVFDGKFNTLNVNITKTNLLLADLLKEIRNGRITTRAD